MLTPAEGLHPGQTVSAIYLGANVSAWRSFRRPRRVLKLDDQLGLVYLEGDEERPYVHAGRLLFEVSE